jgi:membrane-bound lytic murein transglycosylase D
MKKILLGAGIAIVFIVVISAIQQGGAASNTATIGALNTSTTVKVENRVQDYNVYSVNLPKSLDFAGESVPLHQPDIKERVDREFLVNTYWQSNGILLIKRAHRKWFAKC